MSQQDKPRKYIEYPMVIDWLQWSDEFREEHGKPDMPQVTLNLISEIREDNRKLEAALIVATDALYFVDNYVCDSDGFAAPTMELNRIKSEIRIAKDKIKEILR